MVDALDRGLDWSEEVVSVTTPEGSESFVVHKRNPVEIVRHLLGLVRLRTRMRYGPERHTTVTINGERVRVYSEMWTGEWWWRMQELLGEGATIAPFILATDETHLTALSGSKVAWPVYASIGNIPKAVRRRPSEQTMMLIGLIPVAKLAWISDETEQETKRWELYHACMALILEPLKAAAREGVEIKCADGGVRRVYPILAAHLGDWPEQATVGSTFKTRCPVCVAPFHERGSWGAPARLRTKPQTVDTIRLGRLGLVARLTGLTGLGLRLVLPYWTEHPWAAGPASIVPDLLHQLWKGMYLNHIRIWWTRMLGERTLDARYMGVPRYAGQQHFSLGLSALTQWQGNEARATAQSFLGIIAGSRPQQAVQAARCIMDFLYRARMPQLDEDDLVTLDADLREFHEVKQIFITEGAHTSEYGFNNIAKLHILRHYSHLTREMGTPDGFTTETPERLHKDYVKASYHASNGIVPEPQMLTHLRRQEAWQMLRAKYEREGLIEKCKRQDDRMDGYEAELDLDDHTALSDAEYENDIRRNAFNGVKEREVFQFTSRTQIAKRPPHVTSAWNNTPSFLPTITAFVYERSPNLAFHLNKNTCFGIWSKFSIRHDPLPFAPLVGYRIDLVRATPACRTAGGQITRPAVYDTVLVESYPDMDGLLRYQPARVLLIFQLPALYHEACSEPLAFVEWFDPFDPVVEAQHRLPTTRPTKQRDVRATAIVPIRLIRASCHLIPNYELLDPHLQISAESDLLSIAPQLFLSRHSSYYFFAVMDHWQRITR
ncbi:hypothetical protein BDV93DRAFT_447042 [Ceratobasidium sp. AG-I]|nr:hypothetical protein BDV93DRAFT_447042 [Ceratobasidium sp. AG-I]